MNLRKNGRGLCSNVCWVKSCVRNIITAKHQYLNNLQLIITYFLMTFIPVTWSNHSPHVCTNKYIHIYIYTHILNSKDL